MTRISIESRPDRPLLKTEAGALIPRLLSSNYDHARVALVAGGALLLGGDLVDIEITVGKNCSLEIEEIGGTVAYDADLIESNWNVRLTLEENARLIWQGLPFVVSNGANVLRSTEIDLAEGAVACIRETIVLGRHAELGGRILSKCRARVMGKLALVEEIQLDGYQGMPGILGDHRVLDTCLLLGDRADDDKSEPWVLQLEQPGSMARHIGMDTHSSRVTKLWSEWAGQVTALAQIKK
jgi:urease accessory protein